MAEVTIEILEAVQDDKPILRNMMQLYQYDLSEIDGTDLGEHGQFTYPYLEHYWTEEGRHAFLVKADGALAGFVLVNRHHYLPGTDQGIAEFFVMRRFRRRGIGRHVAREIFRKFPGHWEVRVLPGNLAAEAFWISTIDQYTGGAFELLPDGFGDWRGPILRLRSGGKSEPAV
jgi:predicted acetyltransferase